MINRERLCVEFARQAAISSPVRHEGNMASYLKQRFAELGASCSEDGAAVQVGGESGNLVFRLSGSTGADPLMLSVHMDTVSPCEAVEPVLKEGIFRSAGETILGADDKAGIAELIEALEVCKEQGIPLPPLEIVVTVCEEVGLLGAKNFDCSQLQSRRGIALDTNGTGILIHRAPGANKFRFKVTGREAHAGIAPETGLSAIETAACAINLMQLGRIDYETTANIGSIHGGQATNIVPREVILEGEVRSHDGIKLKAQTDQLLACLDQATEEMTRTVAGKLLRPTWETEVLADYPIMKVATSASVISLVEAAAGSIGQPLEVATAGGGSDANIFNQQGIETVILGTGMEMVHTVEEQVAVADMVKVSELLVAILRRAGIGD